MTHAKRQRRKEAWCLSSCLRAFVSSCNKKKPREENWTRKLFQSFAADKTRETKPPFIPSAYEKRKLFRNLAIGWPCFASRFSHEDTKARRHEGEHCFAPLRLGIALILTGLITSCATKRPSALPSLSWGYMPLWTQTRFDEAEYTASGVLHRPYHEAVHDAWRHDRKALVEVISCSYSKRCDAAAGEIHAEVLQSLLLAWGDIEFSQALAEVKTRHQGHYPTHAFLMQEQNMRAFFPLTTNVLYGK